MNNHSNLSSNPDDLSRAEPGAPIASTRALPDASMARKPLPANSGPIPRRPRRQISTPPYNPGLHNLVNGKQAWAVPLSNDDKENGFLGWHQRGYLPHHDAPGVTQIVTFRLADSLPANRRSEWELLLKIEDNLERRRLLEAYLDRGLGECWLERPVIAALAENTLRYFDGQRYALAAWVVMPNHIHVLVDVWDVPLVKIIKSWKVHIALEANKVLRRSGEFWEREYLDTVIHGEKHHQTAVKYLESNPVKAGLVAQAVAWPWSSVRFRDEYGRLNYSAGRQPSSVAEPGPFAHGAPTSGRLTSSENK